MNMLTAEFVADADTSREDTIWIYRDGMRLGGVKRRTSRQFYAINSRGEVMQASERSYGDVAAWLFWGHPNNLGWSDDVSFENVSVVLEREFDSGNDSRRWISL